MCGISGIISNSISASNKLKFVAVGNVLMEHRGPDAAQTWNDDIIHLGHRRLAIIDLDESSNQPMTESTGRYTNVFNGEIFNYRNLRSELEGSYPFKTLSDTEVILQSYRKWGKACCQHLEGQFAFAIWDGVEQSLFFARDRMGEKPFYYSLLQKNQGFIFFSEFQIIRISIQIFYHIIQ